MILRFWAWHAVCRAPILKIIGLKGSEAPVDHTPEALKGCQDGACHEWQRRLLRRFNHAATAAEWVRPAWRGQPAHGAEPGVRRIRYGGWTNLKSHQLEAAVDRQRTRPRGGQFSGTCRLSRDVRRHADPHSRHIDGHATRG